MSKVYDGSTESSSQLLRFSSNTPPAQVQSSSNVMLVTFTTDGSVVSSGFEAAYQTTSTVQTTTLIPGISLLMLNLIKFNFQFICNISESCQFTLNGNAGAFHSPNYPSTYLNNMRCSWLIRSELDTAILLQFNSFTTELCCDFVTVILSHPIKVSTQLWTLSKLYHTFDRCTTALQNRQTSSCATATAPLQPLSNRLPTLCWSRSLPMYPSYHPDLMPCIKRFQHQRFFV